MSKGVWKELVALLLLTIIAVFSFWFGRRTARPTVRTLSDLQLAVGGQRHYWIDTDVKCPDVRDSAGKIQPGKNLGKLQVDLDLTNGKLRVVRNDAGKEPSCSQ